MGDGDESVLGQLPHDVQVCPHVQLAADQHHLGVGTELLGLTLPLRVTRTGTGCLTSPKTSEVHKGLQIECELFFNPEILLNTKVRGENWSTESWKETLAANIINFKDLGSTSAKPL